MAPLLLDLTFHRVNRLYLNPSVISSGTWIVDLVLESEDESTPQKVIFFLGSTQPRVLPVVNPPSPEDQKPCYLLARQHRTKRLTVADLNHLNVEGLPDPVCSITLRVEIDTDPELSGQMMGLNWDIVIFTVNDNDLGLSKGMVLLDTTPPPQPPEENVFE